MIILDEFYQELIKTSMHENRKTQQKNIDYSNLYYKVSVSFPEDRMLNIRYVKFPTFINENKQYYYTVFINDIQYWRAGEKKQIYKLIIETVDKQYIDSYTIFQFGKYHGHNDPVINHLMKYYHIYVFNKQTLENKDKVTIQKFIADFIQKRINNMKKDGIIFGCIEKDVKRLQDFVDFLNSIYSYYIISNPKKNSSYTSYYNKNRKKDSIR